MNGVPSWFWLAFPSSGELSSLLKTVVTLRFPLGPSWLPTAAAFLTGLGPGLLPCVLPQSSSPPMLPLVLLVPLLLVLRVWSLVLAELAVLFPMMPLVLVPLEVLLLEVLPLLLVVVMLLLLVLLLLLLVVVLLLLLVLLLLVLLLVPSLPLLVPETSSLAVDSWPET